jgi:adenine/guanine phosphoribosyltransferase-like PRPP-binding protein
MPYTLKRQHFSGQQAGSNRTDRSLSIQEMFYVEERHLELLQGHSVIVFDDVMTSGATLNEIARVLKDNGVNRVTNWVLLRTSKSSSRS